MLKRHFRDDVSLSIIGLGGMTLLGMDRSGSRRLVAEAIERGVNYFDVAPLYGDGEAENALGAALEGYRNQSFLACKTIERDAESAGGDLEESLRRLHTDHFDLYQFHAVTRLDEVDRIFGARGAIETVARAREAGTIRFIGFSAHSAAAALAMMHRFTFDAIQFPVNFVCAARNPASRDVLVRARAGGVARIALKAMAHSRWGRHDDRIYRNCWYKPIDDLQDARQALRFTLSEDVTTLLPPGDPRLFRIALSLASDLPPLSDHERAELLGSARGVRPVIEL